MGDQNPESPPLNGGKLCVLDTCVLVPVSLTDTLLRCAESGLFSPIWSEEILSELTRALPNAHPHHDPTLLQRRVHLMAKAFPGALHDLTEDREPVVRGLPDSHDEHVLQLALSVGAPVIVTINLRDFPDGICNPLGIQAIHPGDLLVAFATQTPRLIADVLSSQARDTRSPTMTVSRVVSSLGVHVPDFVAYWRAQADNPES